MLRARIALRLLGAVLLTGAAVPVGAAALIAPVLPRGAAEGSLLLREQVRSAGVFDISVGIDSSAKAAGIVDLQIGSRIRRRATVTAGHRAVVRVRLPIHGRSLTIRAFAQSAMPKLRVTVRRVPRDKPRTLAKTGASAGPQGATAAGGSSGSSGLGGPAVSSLLTGSTAASGSTGSTGVSPPVDVAGGSGLMLPPGFLPVANYASLVKDYEFDGSSLPADWSVSNGTTHGFAGTIFNASQVSLTGSSVALSVSNQPSGGYAYQSGWISTEGSFSLTHGLIDFRAKMPAGQGLWSGLWLDQPDGSNPWGEIDVQEMLLANTHTVYGSLHGWAPSQWGETQSTSMPADASSGFHDYQVVWQPGLLTWAVDGVAYAQYTQAQAQAAGYPWVADDGGGYYLIADLAAGSNVWGGPPSTSTPFPSSMQLQSVKIWQ